MATAKGRAPRRPRTKVQGKKTGQYHHGNLRRALLDAALDIAVRKGPHGVTLSEAGRQAGVSSGAPFHHFANKDELMAALVEEGAQLLTDAAAAEMSQAGERPADVFLAIGIAHVKFAVAHPAHFRVMAVPEFAAQAQSPIMDAAIRSSNAAVQSILASKRPGAKATRATVELAARSLMHGLATMFVDGQLSREGIGPEEAEEVARAVSRVLQAALTQDD